MVGEEILCPDCVILLAVMGRDGDIEVKSGKRVARFYGSGLVSLDCPKCGRTVLRRVECQAAKS